MKISTKEKLGLLEWLRTFLLMTIGFEKIITNGTKKIADAKTCYCPEWSEKMKTVAIVVLNKGIADAMIIRLQKWYVENATIENGKGGEYSTVFISFKDLLFSKERIGELDEKVPTVKHSKEFLKVSEILSKWNPNIIEYDDVTCFTVLFQNPKDCEDAKELLTAKKVNYILGDEQKIFVFRFLPDYLFEKEYRKENTGEKNIRQIIEYTGLLSVLIDIISKQFKIKFPHGGRHTGYGYVLMSGDNENRTLKFNSEAQKALGRQILFEAGFHCDEPEDDGDHTLMVDLLLSKQKTLIQKIIVQEPAIETVTPITEEPKQDLIIQKTVEKMEAEVKKLRATMPAIKELLKKHGFQIGSIGRYDGKHTIPVKDGDTENALKIIKETFDVPGAKLSRQAIHIPLEEVVSERRKSSEDPETVTDSNKEQSTKKAPSLTQLVNELAAAIKEEAKSGQVAILKAENKKLEGEIKTLKAELKAYKEKVAAFKKAFD